MYLHYHVIALFCYTGVMEQRGRQGWSELEEFSLELDHIRSAHKLEQPYDNPIPDGGQLLARKQGKFLQVGNFHQFGLMRAAFNRQLEMHRILTLDLEGVDESGEVSHGTILSAHGGTTFYVHNRHVLGDPKAKMDN